MHDLRILTYQMAFLNSLSLALRLNLTALTNQNLILSMKGLISPALLHPQPAIVQLVILSTQLAIIARIATLVPIARRLDTQLSSVANVSEMKAIKREDNNQDSITILKTKEICLMLPVGVVAKKGILQMIPNVLSSNQKNLQMLSLLHLFQLIKRQL